MNKLVPVSKRAYLSEVPPPVVRRLGCHGHQAMPFIAAVCSVSVCRGDSRESELYTQTTLSLPPLARYCPS